MYNISMTILILHGWMQNTTTLETLKKQLESISKTNEVIAIDMPGFGQEPLISNDWGVPEYAQWVEQKVASLKLKSVVLLGHSFGGRVSALIASKNPTWLKALILSGTPAIYRPSSKTQLKNALTKRVKQFVPEKYKSIIYTSEMKDAVSKQMGQVLKNVVIFDQTKTLPHITVPTLLIWGEQDDSVPLPIAREIHQLIKGSTLAIIKGGIHNAFISHPYLFFGHVKKFIETL